MRVEGSGVCASELPLWAGREWFTYPRPAGEPGHEGWGVVQALGEEVVGLALGERVTFVGSRAHAELAAVPAGECVRPRSRRTVSRRATGLRDERLRPLWGAQR